MRNRYALTYDLKILYCPDIDLNLACKELDLTSLQFHLYDEDREYLNTGFELNPKAYSVVVMALAAIRKSYNRHFISLFAVVTHTKDHIQRKICLLTVHCETI